MLSESPVLLSQSLTMRNHGKRYQQFVPYTDIPNNILKILKGYGYADAELRTKVKPTTLFSAGSTTKSFTAAAASLLVDDETKNITWETAMHQLIPDDFILSSTYATSHITLEDALCHRTGIPSHHADLGGHSVKENVRKLRYLQLTKEPRTTWQYSNHMYWAVSHMIETHSGLSLEQFMKEKLWKPLDMKHTFLSIKITQNSIESKNEIEFAKPHMWDEDSESFKVLPYWDDEGISGAGGIVSNVVDYAKWVKSFIGQNGPLSQEGYAAVTTPHIIMPPLSTRFTGPLCYGFGWWISVYHGEKVLLHPGGLIGSASSMIYLPDKKWGVVGMCNATTEAILDTTMWYLVDRFLGIPLDKEVYVVAE